MRVLVAYGSKRGGTAGLARAIGDVLVAQGHAVDVVSAREAASPASYDAVIVGGALYAMRWQRDAWRYALRHADELRAKPVWLFSSGPLDDTADTQDLPPVPRVRRLAAELGARGHVTFGGRLEPDARGFIASRMAKTHAGDWRDFERAAAWARGIAEALPTIPPSPRVQAPPAVAALRAVLELLCAFSGITAAAGGIILMANRWGGHGLPPLELLRHTPFSTFFWPGVLLLVVIGGSNLAAALHLARRDPGTEVRAGFAGGAMVVWILCEIALLRTFVWLQALYLVVGLATFVLAAWLFAARRPRSLRRAPAPV